jgi:hypothetical protein
MTQTFTATYSPDDNKIRLYASSRLDSETYARVKAAGFRWAPKQDLFFTTWSPRAEGGDRSKITSYLGRAKKVFDNVRGEARVMADPTAPRRP